MHSTNSITPRVRRLPPRATLGILLSVTALVSVSGARADIFHLRNGGTVEGQLLATEGDAYKIRTAVGTVTLPASAVESIEQKPSIFGEYDRHARDTADTPEAQTALANWCDEQGLKSERRKHLLRAIELDADYAPARRALGYVRVGQFWVDGRRVVDRRPEPERPDEGTYADPQRLARAIQREWTARIRAIRQSYLESALERLVDEGRARVLEINDPLAIFPLTDVLSRGDAACRALLIEALGHFPEDEATLNLAVLGLLDAERDLRRRAVAELARRNDLRVVAQYRAALRTGNDVVLLRAASALGELRAAEAVPDLIAALTAQRQRWIELPKPRYFLDWPQIFSRSTSVHFGVGSSATLTPRLGVYWGAFGSGPVDSDYVLRADTELRWVTVLRTDVLEALRRITGQDFGFEQAQWQQWYADSRP